EFDCKNEEAKLPEVWQWNHNPDNNLCSVDVRKGYLRLTTGRVDTDVLQAKNTLIQRTFGPESSAGTAIDIRHMKDGDYAGLIALERDYGFVGVKREDNRKLMVVVAKNDEDPVELASIAVLQDTVYLRIDCDYNTFDGSQPNDKANF